MIKSKFQLIVTFQELSYLTNCLSTQCLAVINMCLNGDCSDT